MEFSRGEVVWPNLTIRRDCLSSEFFITSASVQNAVVAKGAFAAMELPETSRVGLAIFLKALCESKTRLSDLDPCARSDLAMAMTRDVLAAAVQSTAVSRIFLVSADPAAVELATQSGAKLVVEQVGEGLNRAARAAINAMRLCGMQHCVLLPADIPLLDCDTLDRITSLLMNRLKNGSDLGIVPCRRDQGTNLLLCKAETPPTFRYEGASFAAHMAEARNPAVMRDFRLGFDIDEPADLADLTRFIASSSNPPRWTASVLTACDQKVAA